MSEPEALGHRERVSTWLLPGLWIILACLLASLIGLAVLLLVKMDFFSTKSLTDEQLKSVWAFLGVALGAVVTLIGTLLTEQHSRRTVAITREASERERLARAEQQALAKQAEKRLRIDTVAKTLELITTDSGDYAQRARVGGAIATMMELEGGIVAIRILGDLWAADAVDSNTAVWLINRVLEGSERRDELAAATYLLVSNVSKLVPAKTDAEQERVHFPSLLFDSWPQQLPHNARNSLLVMAVRLLMVRDLEYWRERSAFPIHLVFNALDDPDFAESAGFVLAKLDDLGVLDELDIEPSGEDLARIRALSESFPAAGWFANLVAQLERWARGEYVSEVASSMTGSVAAAGGSSSSPSPPSTNAETPSETEEPDPSHPA